MRLVHAVIAAVARLAAVVRRRRLDRDIEDELAFHLAMRQADHEADGVTRADARLAARRQFGNVTALREETRDMWTFPSFESLVQDVRFGVRTLRKSPGFTVVAVLALAVGIGANTAIFSLIDAMLLRGLPYANADRLVVLIGNVQRAGGVERRGGSYLDFVDWQAQATQFDGMAAYDSSTVTLSGEGDPVRLNAEAVSAPYFDVLGVRPAIGRTFQPAEDQPGAPDAVVILSDGLWKRTFGGDASVIGRRVRLGTRSFEVVGVMPPGFTGLTDQAELWLPFIYSGYQLDNRGNRGLQAVARLSAAATLAQAEAEMTAVAKRLEAEYPRTNDARGVEVTSLSTLTFGTLQPAVFALMGAVTFVLLIACANVANLLISRSEVRQREIAVRTALGAGRGRLVRQLVTESCVLAILGGAAGVGLAYVALPAALAASPIGLPSFATPALNVPVLLFTLGASLAVGVLLGLAPSLHSRAAGLGQVLKDSARGSTGAAARRLRGALVVVEVALAVMLLVGAGLMIRTVQNLLAVDPGFDPASVLTLNVAVPRQPVDPAAPPPPANTPPPPFVASAGALLDRIRAVPGVVQASLVSDVPLGGSSSAVFYTAEGDQTTTAAARPRAYVHRVTPGFFDTLRVPLVAGRTFTTAELNPVDRDSVIVVSQEVVRCFWPGEDGLGRRIKLGGPDSTAPWLTIVGVVPELKYRALPANPTADPDLYFPYVDRGSQGILVRTSGDPAAIVPSVRAAVREASPEIVVFGVSELGALVDAQTSQSRFTTWLMGAFASTALALAMIGIYGVMSYLVTQRRREFGIRLALGATRRQIVSVVLGDATRMVAIGLVIGGAAALGLSRLLDALLFGLPSIGASSAIAIGVLAAVALAASALPAIRATRVDPVVALRDQ